MKVMVINRNNKVANAYIYVYAWKHTWVIKHFYTMGDNDNQIHRHNTEDETGDVYCICNGGLMIRTVGV